MAHVVPHREAGGKERTEGKKAAGNRGLGVKKEKAVIEVFAEEKRG